MMTSSANSNRRTDIDDDDDGKLKTHQDQDHEALLKLILEQRCKYTTKLRSKSKEEGTLKNTFVKYYNEVMQDKYIDYIVSHNHPVNRFLHFWSSFTMLMFAYPSLFVYRKISHGCVWLLIGNILRQSGHFFYEKQDLQMEKLKFRKRASARENSSLYRRKKVKTYTMIVLTLCITMYHYFVSISFNYESYIGSITLFVGILPRFLEITFFFEGEQGGFLRAVFWILKILSDPITNLFDFYDSAVSVLIHPKKYFLDMKIFDGPDADAVYKLDLKTGCVTNISMAIKN